MIDKLLLTVFECIHLTVLERFLSKHPMKWYRGERADCSDGACNILHSLTLILTFPKAVSLYVALAMEKGIRKDISIQIQASLQGKSAIKEALE